MIGLRSNANQCTQKTASAVVCLTHLFLCCDLYVGNLMNTVYLNWHPDNGDDNKFTYKLSRVELDIRGLTFGGPEGNQRALNNYTISTIFHYYALDTFFVGNI